MPRTLLRTEVRTPTTRKVQLHLFICWEHRYVSRGTFICAFRKVEGHDTRRIVIHFPHLLYRSYQILGRTRSTRYRLADVHFSHAHKHKCLRLIVVEQRSSSNDSNRLTLEYCSHYIPTGDTSKQHTKLLLNTDIRSPENRFESKTTRSYVLVRTIHFSRVLR